MLLAARYRLGQLGRALGAAPTAADPSLLRTYLAEPQERLFRRAKLAMQNHQIRVCRVLLEQGETNRDLLVAALLHDVGKGDIALLERGLLVLCAALRPGLLGRLVGPRRWAWQRRLGDFLDHGAVGARWARTAGVSVRAAGLIAAHHHPHDGNPLVLRLRLADEAD